MTQTTILKSAEDFQQRIARQVIGDRSAIFAKQPYETGNFLAYNFTFWRGFPNFRNELVKLFLICFKSPRVPTKSLKTLVVVNATALTQQMELVFSEIKDPRVERTRAYLLTELPTGMHVPNWVNRCESMSRQPNSSSFAQLKQLWGGRVPPLTPEQIDLSIKLRHKIKARREREQQRG